MIPAISAWSQLLRIERGPLRPSAGIFYVGDRREVAIGRQTGGISSPTDHSPIDSHARPVDYCLGNNGEPGDASSGIHNTDSANRPLQPGDATLLPGVELMGCQGLAVPAQVMHHVVRVESSFNPYAIGVVGGRLVRQPKNLSEALSTVRMLESRGYNFSLGLAQVNRYNLQRYGLGSYERAFEPCSNLLAGSQILAECYRRSGADWGKSFSCYYSGNFTTGFRHGYVQKIYASMRQGRDVEETPAGPAIEVVSRQARRTVPVSRFPLYTDNAAPVPVPEGPAVAADLPIQSPVAPSRAQRVPSRIVPSTPSNDLVREAFAVSASPAGAAQSAPAPAVVQASATTPAPIAPSPNLAAAVVAPASVVVPQPSVVSVSQPSAQTQQMSAVPTRPRGGRDPALVGGQVAEQDGAFVF